MLNFSEDYLKWEVFLICKLNIFQYSNPHSQLIPVFGGGGGIESYKDDI